MTKIAPSGNVLRVALCLGRSFKGFIRSRRCIGDLERGRIDRDRHREHQSHRCTSLLRHFVQFTLAPRLLPSGVPSRSATGALIPCAGTAVRGTPGHCRALAGTINIAAIAPPADAHRHAAAPAAIQPVALFPLLHRTPPQDWTAPCFAGINAVRKIAPTGISPLEAREFLTGFPGLHCFGVACSLSGNGSARHERAEIQQKNTEIGASAADGGRPRLLYAVDDVNKPRMNPNRSPGRRRSNRAFPQNQADLDPHRQAQLYETSVGRRDSRLAHCERKEIGTRMIRRSVASSVSLGRASQASTWKLRAVPRRHHSQKCSQLLVNSR
jgi:hypothetical protein